MIQNKENGFPEGDLHIGFYILAQTQRFDCFPQVSKIFHPAIDQTKITSFRNASRRKSQCFFRAKLRIRQSQVENAITLKWLKVETWNLKFRWGTHESFFVQILAAIGQVIRVSKPKTEMSIEGLNSFSSKTNWSRSIKVPNLEAPGNEFRLPNLNHDNADSFFLLFYLFI